MHVIYVNRANVGTLAAAHTLFIINGYRPDRRHVECSITGRLCSFPFFLILMFTQGTGQLIRARGAFAIAPDAFKPGNHIVDVAAFNEVADALAVAVAASFKRHATDHAFRRNVKLDSTGTDPGSFEYHNKPPLYGE